MACFPRISQKAVKHFFLASFVVSFILFGLAYYNLMQSNNSKMTEFHKLQMLPWQPDHGEKRGDSVSSQTIIRIKYVPAPSSPTMVLLSSQDHVTHEQKFINFKDTTKKWGTMDSIPRSANAYSSGNDVLASDITQEKSDVNRIKMINNDQNQYFPTVNDGKQSHASSKSMNKLDRVAGEREIISTVKVITGINENHAPSQRRINLTKKWQTDKRVKSDSEPVMNNDRGEHHDSGTITQASHIEGNHDHLGDELIKSKINTENKLYETRQAVTGMIDSKGKERNINMNKKDLILKDSTAVMPDDVQRVHPAVMPDEVQRVHPSNSYVNVAAETFQKLNHLNVNRDRLRHKTGALNVNLNYVSLESMDRRQAVMNKTTKIEQLRSEKNSEIKELEKKLDKHKKEFDQFVVRFQQKINESRLRNLEYFNKFEQERLRNKFQAADGHSIELHSPNAADDKLKSIKFIGEKSSKLGNDIQSFNNDDNSDKYNNYNEYNRNVQEGGVALRNQELTNHEGHYHELFYQSNNARVIRFDKCRNCMSLNFPFVINQEGLCEPDKSIDLVILISVSLYSSQNRHAIRKTWGSLCNNRTANTTANIKCVFLLAKHPSSTNRMFAFIKEESYKHQDIVLIDFIDSYANLTYKTLMGLKWVEKFCSNAMYVMKTDGDVFVNTEQIPIMLKAAPKLSFIGGYCWGISTPHRDESSKWHVPFHLYTKPKFPPMCSGTGYIMSSDLVQSILVTATDIPYFYLEDVYIALCLQKNGIQPVNLAGFSNTKQYYEPCNYRYYILTSHGVEPEELEEYWGEMLTQCSFQKMTPDELYLPLPYPEVF